MEEYDLPHLIFGSCCGRPTSYQQSPVGRGSAAVSCDDRKSKEISTLQLSTMQVVQPLQGAAIIVDGAFVPPRQAHTAEQQREQHCWSKRQRSDLAPPLPPYACGAAAAAATPRVFRGYSAGTRIGAVPKVAVARVANLGRTMFIEYHLLAGARINVIAARYMFSRTPKDIALK